jgi:hypothetical protein
MSSAAPDGTSTPASDASAERVFRIPVGVRAFSIVAVIILLTLTLVMSAFAAIIFVSNRSLGLLVAVCAGLIGALSGYGFRDLRGKLGLRIALGKDAVTLDLPAGRSLIHRPVAQHLTIPYSDIQAIEARFEGFRSLGMANMQQAFVLRRKNNDLVFLFEERALATRFASSLFADIAKELAERAHVPIRDIGTVEGRGGLLCTWGTEAPDWAAPPLPRDQALRLWRHAAGTGSLAMAIFLFLIVARFFRYW